VRTNVSCAMCYTATYMQLLICALLLACAVTPDAPLCMTMLTHLEAGAAAMILASDCAAAVRPLATGHSSSCTSADTPPGGHANSRTHMQTSSMRLLSKGSQRPQWKYQAPCCPPLFACKSADRVPGKAPVLLENGRADASAAQNPVQAAAHAVLTWQLSELACRRGTVVRDLRRQPGDVVRQNTRTPGPQSSFNTTP
jgi:hypothetical protein